MIELKHVSYAYADETTNNLKDISLTAYDGEITYVPECQAVVSQLY